ncbi:MAG: quinone-dependent dihydroorotate dehydrogenase [Gammaproteobacteria bacterium]|nr:quinone-dependent dihydroorotate dehydrogenase [Gammaproteobacteria bacterium]
MGIYRLIRAVLFRMDPEKSHTFSLEALKWLNRCHLLKRSAFSDPCTVMGLSFLNRLGLAAGLDKNGDYIEPLLKLGFGFIEVGTVTPKPQGGNPKPRLFRLPAERALINRMGFNNKGVDYLVERLKACQGLGIIGVNIGKNKDTPLESALSDYEICLEKVALFSSYVTINISSPNTPGLRDLQHEDALRTLLSGVIKKRDVLAEKLNRHLPILVKVSPDLTKAEIAQMSQVFLECAVDGVIATNTTIDRSEIHHPLSVETGGLSGRPLFKKSTDVLSEFHRALKGRIPLIGVGGVFNAEDLNQKRASGAELIQVYTGFVYQGFDIFKAVFKKACQFN